jgi:hypothetical protein
MACSECKKNGKLKDEANKAGQFVSKGVIIVFVTWTILGIYGLITLISKFI